MENEISPVSKVISTVMQIPGIKVDREKFLRSEFRLYCTQEELEKVVENPLEIIPKNRIEKIADACIRNQTAKVSLLSTIAGVPGGLAMAATIPADMAQYYYHIFVMAQKLAYLYGFSDLCGEDGRFTETSQDMLILFVGVMSGVAGANQALKKITPIIAANAVKRIPNVALTKTWYYPIITKIARTVFGQSVTKKGFAKQIGKVIPFVGGAVSGGITLATFYPSAKRLQKQLRDQMDDIKAAGDRSKEAEDI